MSTRVSSTVETKQAQVGRRFRIMILPQGEWLYGKVIHWKQYANRPIGENYDLYASIAAAETCNRGAVVQHKSWLPGKPFVVHEVYDDDETDVKTQRATLVIDDNRLLPRQPRRSLEPVGGNFFLRVVKMNPQGGGTVVSVEPKVGIADSLLSLEWLDPMAQTFLDVDAPLPPYTSDLDRLASNRFTNLQDLTNEMAFQGQATSGLSLAAVVQRLHSSAVGDQIRAPAELRETLRALPFVVYPSLLLPRLDQMGRADAESVRAWLHFGFDAYTDNDWTKECQDFVVANAQSSSDADDEKIRQEMFSAIFKLVNGIGVWFAQVGEYQAAVWCHEKTLSLSAAHGVETCLVFSLDFLSQTYHQYGNMLAAFQCLEQSMALRPTTNRIELARTLQKAAPSYIGTSGRLTPYTLRESVPTDNPAAWPSREKDTPDPVCGHCATGNAPHVARCCRLVHYCNAQCQRAHWVRVHKHTCLFGRLGS